MVQVQAWDEFEAKAEALCRAKPLDTRYTIKYKHKDGKMALKVTDNVVVSVIRIPIERTNKRERERGEKITECACDNRVPPRGRESVFWKVNLVCYEQNLTLIVCISSSFCSV